MTKTHANGPNDLVPVECYLHRIFPAGVYSKAAKDIIARRLYKPRADCDDFSLKTPIDWEARDRLTDRNWRMQLQGWAVFQPIMNFFDDYEDKQAILAFFFDLARDWWARYGDDPETIVTSRMPDSYAWYDMSVGFRGLIIAFLKGRTDAFGLAITDDDAQLLGALASKHIAHLTYEPAFSLNNHGVFQAHALMALLMAFDDVADHDCKHAYALESMERLIVSQFDENGHHTEHSPHYHFYVLDTFESILKSGWFASSTTIKRRVELAREMKKWIVDPLMRPICVGDSILTVQKDIEFPQDGTDPVISDFDSSGYQIVRSGWSTPPEDASMVFLMGAYRDKTHKHRDCLSFDWFDRGDRVICDGGKYGYKSNQFRRYCLSYKAHNSVEIEGFDILKMRPYGSAIKPAQKLPGGVYRLGGKLEWPAITQDRSLYIKPGQWLVVEDRLDFSRERKATQWLHLETDFVLVSAQGNSLHAKGKQGRQVFVDCLDADSAMFIHKGDMINLAGYVSQKDYEIKPALTVGFASTCKSKIIRTVIALSPTSRAGALSYIFEAVGSAEAGRLMADFGLKATNLLPNIPHTLAFEPQRLQLHVGPHTYSTIQNGMVINFFADVKQTQEKKLLIMLPGASGRTRGHIDFQRYSWSEDFPEHDVVSISDPSLTPDNTLGLAWFQHSKNNYGLDALEKLIRRIAETGGYAPENVTLFGSSGGGFGVLQLANRFLASRVIAINPQIYLYNYTRSFYEEMLAACYPGESHQTVMRDHEERLVVQIDLAKRQSEIFIFQNSYDTKHVSKHLEPFIVEQDPSLVTKTSNWPPKIVPNAKLNIIFYDDKASGHSPPPRGKTLIMLAPLL